jgi:diguanylate cyclase (GGDEF)-like protein/PAS domain S-box-containing protein
MAVAAEHRSPWRRLGASGWQALPKGGVLSEESWRARHRGIVVVLWAHVLALPVIGVLRDQPLGGAVLEASVVGLFALAACLSHLGTTTRSAAATLGLVSSSAVLVHFFDGLIEAHFHFFVVVAVVALYQKWLPFLVAVGFVLLQHSVIGALFPHQVYSHAQGQANPWAWAVVHGSLILAESLTCLMYWRVSENALDREREARAQLADAHQDLADAQELSGMGSWDWDIGSGRVSWSDQLYLLAGLRKESFTPSIQSFLDLVHPEDRPEVAALLTAAAADPTGLDFECRWVRADGEIRVVHSLSEFVAAPDGTVQSMFGTVHDVTERRLMQEEIERLAFRDALTGLANRRLFLDRLEHVLSSQPRSGRSCAVLFLDLDDFKRVNDTLGHSAGDELLREVGRRLQGAVRPTDTVARLGGDEFALLLEDVDLASATALAERVQSMLRQKVWLQGTELCVRASIGIAVAEEDVTADDILRDADAAMYAVKIGGKDSYRGFPCTRP